MFEDSLMESGNQIKATSKYWSILHLAIEWRSIDRTDRLATLTS